MAVVCHGHGGKRHAVGGVGICADRLTEHVHHPVGSLSAGNESIERPCRRPHYVGTRLVILHVGICNTRRCEQRPEQTFADIIAGVVVLARKILFADVAENIVYARHHLIVRQRERIDGVEHRKPGHDAFIGKHVTYLELLRMVGDDRARVHLAARAHHGEHAAYGHDGADGFFEPDVVLFPGVALAVHRNRQRLGIVAHRAAADCEQQVGAVTPCYIHALVQLYDRGIGHNARYFCHVLAV